MGQGDGSTVYSGAQPLPMCLRRCYDGPMTSSSIPPSKHTVSSNPAAQTPMMRQYLDAKGQHEDCIVLFRMGDFYELFYDDAVLASEKLGLTLTTRDKAKDAPIPMAGVDSG